MKPIVVLLMAALALLTGCSLLEVASVQHKLNKTTPYDDEKMAIYANMKRYGVSRNNVEALGRLTATEPPYVFPRVQISSERVLNPGEHYRVEMDDLILTMKIPNTPPMPGNWIWPYTNLRDPDEATLIDLKDRQGAVHLAELGWYTCNSIFPPGLFGRCEVMGSTITYRILDAQERDVFSTPEKLHRHLTSFQEDQLPAADEVAASLRGETIIHYAGTKIAQKPEVIVINGRKWVSRAMNFEGTKGRHVYSTTLYGDRMLSVSFGMPPHNYNANPDPSTYPSTLKKAFADMEEMVASLRIARINDDGAPDPFVIERVEPAPLPVREKRPAAASQ